MTTINTTTSGQYSFGSGTARTLIPNGELVEAYRKAQGWTREEFEYQSHLAVERAANSDNSDGRFLRRYRLKTSKGNESGIGTTTLTHIENCKPVYAFTLKIVAETLKVPMRNLIQSNDLSGAAAPAVSTIGSAGEIVGDIMRSVDTDATPLTAYQLAQILRKLLNQLVP